MKGRVTLVGDAAGYVTKCSGEGIYFAAKWVPCLAPLHIATHACLVCPCIGAACLPLNTERRLCDGRAAAR